MNNNGINLVSTKNSQLDREQRILMFTRVIAVTLLITIALISSIAFILAATNPLSKIKQDESSTLSGIASLHNKLVTYYLIKDRINNIHNFTSGRKDYTKAIDLFINQVGSDAQITRFDLEKNVITVEISSNSLVPLNKIINDVLSSSTGGKIIKNAKLDSLGLDAVRGEYSAVLEAEAI